MYTFCNIMFINVSNMLSFRHAMFRQIIIKSMHWAIFTSVVICKITTAQ